MLVSTICRVFLPFATAALLAGCGVNESDSINAAAVGSEVDEHGCRPSAGYQWCEYTQQCERPWELAEAQGFDNNAENFTAFCTDGPEAERTLELPINMEPKELPDTL